MRQISTLEKLNMELNAIINSSYDGIFVTDGQGFIKRLNKAYERISTLKAEDIIGLHITELVEQGLINESVTVRVLKKRQSVTIMQTICGKQVMATGSPMWHGPEIIGVITNIRDLTELIFLKEQLQSSIDLVQRYEQEIAYLRTKNLAASNIVAVSKDFRLVLEKACRLAAVESVVLITGETGVGKEVVAKFIHNSGARAQKPFIILNCTNLPEALFESELFGYEPGAFTGANREGKHGLVDLAQDGTLLLDEIGDIPASIQAKLLRLLQHKEYIKVGGNAVKTTNARFLAATNKDLPELVKKGLFREDLYYRLSVIPVHIPPVRERGEDILPLIKFFWGRLNKKYHYNKTISSEALCLLLRYAWPGNVRELAHSLEQMLVLSGGDTICLSDLPAHIRAADLTAAPEREGLSLEDTLLAKEKAVIARAIAVTGDIRAAAQKLGIHRTTLLRKLRKHGLTIS